MQDNPIKYIARTYFQTNKYKKKLINKLSISYFGFIKNFFHFLFKLVYFLKNIDKMSPIIIKAIKKMIGTAIVF